MKIHKTSSLWIVLVAGVLGGALVHAQQKAVQDEDLLNMMDTVKPNPEAKGDASEAVDAVEMGTLDSATASSSENLISVRLNKVGLEDAINLFAQLSGANIIVPELVEAAQISVNLKDVEWRPALQSILDTYNYELYQRVSGSNVYSVRRRPAGAPEPQVVETFQLKYATVPNAARLVRELLPSDAKVSEFASRNMIVVKSTESSLSEVRAVLDSIDKVRQQVFIESKFMELSDDYKKDLGVNWNSLDEVGVTFDGQNSGGFYGKEFTAGNPPPSFNLTAPAPLGTTGDGEYAIVTSVFNPTDFRVFLSALQNDKDVNIVSNPKIIVANEELANISIIRKEPNLKRTSQQSLNDNNAQLSFELDKDLPFFEYGIKLDVTPSVNTSSNITVRIKPSLARKFADKTTESTTDGLDLLSYPIIDEKSVDTVFNLADGQTAAIGGLTEATDSIEENKVPVLGSIPLLGRLFSWTQTVNNQSETIIFVTVGLANTQQINEGIGMPGDAELARKRVITDRNDRTLRDQQREHFEAQQADELQDTLDKINEKEAKRVERRES